MVDSFLRRAFDNFIIYLLALLILLFGAVYSSYKIVKSLIKNEKLIILLLLLPILANAGAVGVYHLDDGSGTTCKDSSYFGLTGTLHNATWNATGKYGNALTFNGTNMRVNIPQNSIYNSSSVTVSVWVFPFNVIGSKSIVINKADGSDNANGWRLEAGTNNIQFSVGNGTEQGTSCSGTYTGWVHIVGSYDASSKVLNLYSNGSLCNTATLASGTMTNSSNQVQIGFRPDWNYYFNGTIDEVRIYNHALSATDIADIFNCSQFVNGTLVTKNESDIDTQILYNVVISNSTKIVTLENVWNTGEYCPAAVLNSVTLTVSNDNFFSPRYYSFTFTVNPTENLTSYLLPLNAPYPRYVSIYVSGLGGALTGANVDLQESMGGTWTRINYQVTDSLGAVGLWLDYTKSYEAIITAAGYNPLYIYFTPTSATYYYTLTYGNTTSGFSNMFSDITFSLTPDSSAFTNSTTNQTVALNITSRNSTLNYFGLNLTYANGTQLFTQQSSDMGGGIINASINISEIGPYLNATLYFLSENYTSEPFTLTKQYFIYASNSSITSLYDIVGPGGRLASLLGKLAQGFLALFVSLAMAGIPASFGMEGGDFVFIGIMSVFALGGWFNPFLWLGLIWYEVDLFIIYGM